MKGPSDGLIHWVTVITMIIFVVTMFGFAWKVILQ